MSDTRRTSADAYEAYLKRTGKASTAELIDAFFEGYKAGLIYGASLHEIARSVVEKLP